MIINRRMRAHGLPEHKVLVFIEPPPEMLTASTRESVRKSLMQMKLRNTTCVMLPHGYEVRT